MGYRLIITSQRKRFNCLKSQLKNETRYQSQRKQNLSFVFLILFQHIQGPLLLVQLAELYSSSQIDDQYFGMHGLFLNIILVMPFRSSRNSLWKSSPALTRIYLLTLVSFISKKKQQIKIPPFAHFNNLYLNIKNQSSFLCVFIPIYYHTLQFYMLLSISVSTIQNRKNQILNLRYFKKVFSFLTFVNPNKIAYCRKLLYYINLLAMALRSLFLLFLFCSILFSVSQAKVIAQSDMKGERLSGFGNIVEVVYDYGDKMKMPEPGAKVIWGIPWRKTSPDDYIQIVEYVKPSCSEEIIIYVAADDYFQLFLNKHPVLWGKQSGKTQHLKVKVKKCQTLCLEFRVKKNNDYSPGGLIYQIHQEQKCKNCPSATHFNQDTCQCKCNTVCNCQYPKLIWNDYPYCSCGCKQIKCKDYFIFNIDTCSCECSLNRKKCPDNQVWNKYLCGCSCQYRECPYGMQFNQQTCKCECSYKVCPLFQTFDKENCSCVCNRKCKKGQILTSNCGCICDRNKLCPSGYTLNNWTCECQCSKKCGGSQILDKNRCLCLSRIY